MDQRTIMEELKVRISGADAVLVGLGLEWNGKDHREAVREAYEKLACLLEGKDYFVLTVCTDGEIFSSSLDSEKITAPCGNQHWYQCPDACTKDIWEEGEAPGGVCPHCGKVLIPNTVEAEHYIEEGYLPSWGRYTTWLSRTLNRNLEVLELGAGFHGLELKLVRWPLEKTVFFNKKAHMYRINGAFSQISAELEGKVEPVAQNSVEFVRKLC